MANSERHRGRLIDHIGLVVQNLEASKAFYRAVFEALNIPMGGADAQDFWADELFVSSPSSAEVQGELTGRHHLAFQARSRAMVDAFYAAAMAHGGRDHGGPGERAYHPGYYAAFVLDPDGNNIEAVFRGEAGADAAPTPATAAPAPGIVPARTALLVMHYQTDITELFQSVAPALLANTRQLCDAARQQGIPLYFAQIGFRPGYPEVSPLNKNGQGIKQLGLFVGDTICPELGRRPDEPIIIAHRASVFFGTDLERRLAEQGVDTLIMVGIASTGVMLSSIAYASDADYRLYTVKDCCYDPDPVVHEHLFATAFESRSTVLTLAQALALLS